ncbi:MAG: PAS domain S-box protein [Thermoanaerobaculia bacterium]
MSESGSPPEAPGEVESLRGMIETLERELAESRAANRALASGQVDAIVDGSGAFLLDQAQTALQESEELFRTIVTTADEGIWTVDSRMAITFANERLASMSGYRVEEMLGRGADEFIRGDARDGVRERFSRLAQEGGSQRHDVPCLRKDGTVLWASVATSALFGPAGGFSGLLGMVTDITDRRSVEAARSRVAAIVESSDDAIFSKSLDGTILTWNAGAEALYGYTPAEAIGMSVVSLFPPDKACELPKILESIQSGHPVRHLESDRRRKDGRMITISLTISPLKGEDGLISGASVVARDVTERHRHEEELRRSEERFRAIFQVSPANIAIGSSSDLIQNANDRYCQFFGYEREEMIGRTARELGLWANAADRAPMIEILRTQGRVQSFASSFRRKNGEVRDGLMTVEPIDLGTEPMFLFMIEDITERKAADKLLRESEERYRLLFDESPMPLWSYDQSTLEIVTANQAAADQYGYTKDELTSMTLDDIRPASEIERARKAIRASAAGRQFAGVWKHKRKDGSLLDVEIHLGDVQIAGRKLRLSMLNDVTGKRSLEEQLRQAQKMEAVGQLAGGVAHDFNNLLTAILGYSELLDRRFDTGDPARADVAEIKRAGERATVLTRQLLAFSRKQVLVPEVLDLGETVGGVLRLLERLIGENITLTLDLAPDLGRVEADPGQMEQVVMNLAVNARDAMPMGGKISFELSNVEVSNVELDEGRRRDHLGVPPGLYVLLSVTDTGTGMAPETRDRIFEPFFTTKEVGRGTGLGLSTVHGIVNQSGGSISVTSALGRGTKFRIYLPRVARPVSGSHPSSGKIAKLKACGTILLVEDDEQLRRLANQVLSHSGYDVLVAQHAEQARGLARTHRKIDLLLTDVVMPGSSGPELALSLAAEHPGMRVLYMSGYTDDAIVQHGVLTPGIQFLQKPFTPNGLLHRIRHVLNLVL